MATNLIDPDDGGAIVNGTRMAFHTGSALLCLALAVSSSALVTLEPTPPEPVGREPVELWFPARVDHFDASNNDTFNMRFYYSDEHYTSSILILLGGSWAVSAGWLQAGLPYEAAAGAGAALFYAEHRYYGQSRPTQDTSVQSLRYLTVDQALADVAQFIEYIRSDQFEGGRYRDARSVGLVGCAYAGSMATWARLAYPHLVDAVVADSGPLLAQEDFAEYLESVTSTLRSQGGDTCVSSVEDAMAQLTDLLQTAGGPAQVSEMFGTCSVISAGTPLDLASFFWFGVTENFARLVQYAEDGDVASACAILTDAGVANPVQRLANWVRAQPLSQPCIETRYTEVVAAHTNTSYDSDASVSRLWSYQTCVEFGWYPSTSGSAQPFLSAVPLEFFHQMCRDFFSTYFDASRLRAGVERTNLFFGGLSHRADHVLSVSGTADPWSALGPQGPHATSLSPVYVAANVTQCRAIRPLSSSDTPELVEIKLSAQQFVYERLTGQPAAVSAAAATYGAAAVWLLAVMAAL